MTIELTGIPGAGKSTVLDSLKELQDRKGFVFDIQRYMLGKTFLPIRGKIGYELVLLTQILLLKKKDWYLLKHVFLFVKSSGNSLFHKMNILRNTLKKLIIYRYIKDKNEVFFIDEGISHIPFTVFVDVDKKINYKDLREFLEFLPPIDSLLIIDAPDNVLLKRVLERGKRGHRRIDFDSQENVKFFMLQSREVLEQLKSYFTGYIYKNIKKDVDTKKIIYEIGLKDV